MSSKENLAPSRGLLSDVTALLCTQKGLAALTASLAQLGASLAPSLSPRVTHLVFGADGDASVYEAAIEQGGVVVVNPGWLLTCAAMEERVDPSPYLIAQPPPQPKQPRAPLMLRGAMDPKPPPHREEGETSSQHFRENSRARQRRPPILSATPPPSEQHSSLLSTEPNATRSPPSDNQPVGRGGSEPAHEGVERETGKGGVSRSRLISKKAMIEYLTSHNHPLPVSGRLSALRQVYASCVALNARRIDGEGAGEASAGAAHPVRSDDEMAGGREESGVVGVEEGVEEGVVGGAEGGSGEGGMGKEGEKACEGSDKGGEKRADKGVERKRGLIKRRMSERGGGSSDVVGAGRGREGGLRGGMTRGNAERKLKEKRLPREDEKSQQAAAGEQARKARGSSDGKVGAASSTGKELSKGANVGASEGGNKGIKRVRAAGEGVAQGYERAPQGKKAAAKGSHMPAEASTPTQLAFSLSADPELRETVMAAAHHLGEALAYSCTAAALCCKHKPEEADELSPRTSHLLVASDNPKRTIKILFALARGTPVVRAEWVLRCVEEGRWISHEPYVAMPAPPAFGRQLRGKTIAVESGEKLSRKTLEQLICAAGGEVVSWRRAKIVIGSARLPPGAEMRTEEWVLDKVMSAGGSLSNSQQEDDTEHHGGADDSHESESEEF
ncbi:MAG: hypothetical protein SGPRY_001884 [Prymnesium sp.]